ncbi:hypothetical protein [Streptomyces salinarius]|uniref:hypothetical protein n=1 Tax=Streptomyces salinarius TaxID=2762598 RepID=UPI00164979A1|nr:hypothetical protein [Streptomyces salinarius]
MPAEKKIESRDGQAVKETVENASSEILDIVGAKGKVTESGAHPIQCSDYAPEDEVHRMRHPWSIYDASDRDLKEAMERLREQLPTKGWKIVTDGPDKSQAQLPQIVANSPDGHMSADIRLWIEAPQSKRSSMIEATVVSDCFRSSPDTSSDES